jgi:hypothetical protein
MLTSLSALLALATLPAIASDAYLVEPMLCQGRIFGDTSRVHPDYSQVLMRFISFKSTRKDGSLADSLQIENAYFGPEETVLLDSADFVETWYTGPLRKKGDQVNRSALSGHGDGLELKVSATNGNTEKLEGDYLIPHGVTGSYGYHLSCTATVVENPSRVDNFTAR